MAKLLFSSIRPTRQWQRLGFSDSVWFTIQAFLDTGAQLAVQGRRVEVRGLWETDVLQAEPKRLFLPRDQELMFDISPLRLNNQQFSSYGRFIGIRSLGMEDFEVDVHLVTSFPP